MLIKRVIYFFQSKPAGIGIKPKWVKCINEEDCLNMARMGFKVKKIEKQTTVSDDDDTPVW